MKGITQDGWISVDKKPEKAGDYLCALKSNDISEQCVCYYTIRNGFQFNDILSNELVDANTVVTHWQPLPKPPIK